MREPARILVVDDNPANLEIMEARLARQGYEVVMATDGDAALIAARQQTPDLILLDVMMPGKDGIQVCKELKADRDLPFMPIILVTAKADPDDIVAGLEAGGDEYITKPVDHAALVARVRSILRIKALHDVVQEQAARLEDWSRTLEARVAAQVGEIERLGTLKRFLSPQVAELVVSAGEQRLLESHRREVTVVFCDLRGFTAFAELSEPEEVMGVLRQYHAALGELIFRHQGTLERFVGDGLVVLFNDPLPCADHSPRAVRMAIEMRARMAGLAADWRRHGHELGFGVGIARGYATLGTIGFEGRSDYAAIGPVANLASRLCDEAADGEILVSQRVLNALGGLALAEPAGELVLKGFARPVAAHRIADLGAG
jgi:adenylate cyclase